MSFEVARLGVRIEEVRYAQPTLSDVFLHLTGREMMKRTGGRP